MIKLKKAFSIKKDYHGLSAIKAGILIILTIILFCLWLLSCFPVLNRDIFTFSLYENNQTQTSGLKKAHIDKTGTDGTDSQGVVSFDFLFSRPLAPQIPDYLIVTMTAKNSGPAAYPDGSFSVKLGSYEALHQNRLSGNAVYEIYERQKFYIDGLRHKYYVPLGENRFYRYDFSPGQNILKEQVESISMEFPQIEGVLLDIEKIELKKRVFFAPDSYINYFLKNNFSISELNRYITPLYIFIILSVLIYIIYRLMLLSQFKKRPHVALSYLLAVIMILSVIYFMAAGSFYSVKSYWDSYKKYIFERNLDEAYYGFYDFEKFISWLDKKIPAGENLCVLVKGEPVYIMAEMVYNLYPRDIKFVDISKKNEEEIISRLQEINGLYREQGQYRYVAVLSGQHSIDSDNMQFISRYSKNGGLLYILK